MSQLAQSRGLQSYNNVKPRFEVKILMHVNGFRLCFMLFIGLPLTFAISLLRDPSKVEWPIVEIDKERNKCVRYIEIRLYDDLLFNGYDVKTQVHCGRYRIDLTILENRLAIESDRKAFNSSKKQKDH